MDTKMTSLELPQTYEPKDDLEREALEVFRVYLETSLDDLRLELDRIKGREELEAWAKD